MVHLGEGILNAVELNLLGDELVERQASLLEEVDKHREVAARQAVAVPGRLNRAAAPEDLDEWGLPFHVRSRDADEHQRAGKVAGVVRLLEDGRVADRIDRDVGAELGDLLDGRDWVLLLGVDGVRRAELLGPLQLPVVNVDGDDGLGAGQLGASDGCVSHAAAAEHGNGVAACRPGRC